MISLREASTVFNYAEFTDVLGKEAFVGQLLPFNDSTRSSDTSRRRILEVDPDISVPGVIIQVSTGEYFIVGAANADYFKKEIIRHKHPIIPAESGYFVRTVSEILNTQDGSDVCASLSFIRREAVTDSSDFLGGFTAVLPRGSDIGAGDYLIGGFSYYRALRDSTVDELGLTVVDLIDIPDAVQTLDITVKGTYDPVTETSSDVITAAYCVVEERERSYMKTRMDAAPIENGDFTVHTLHVCDVGDIVGNYDIIHKITKGSVNELHCRRT